MPVASRGPHESHWRLQYDAAGEDGERTEIKGSRDRLFDEFVLEGVVHVEALSTRLYHVCVGGWTFDVWARADGTTRVGVQDHPEGWRRA